MTDEAAARVAEQIIHSLPTTESLCVADYEEVAEYLRAYGDQRAREALEAARQAVGRLCSEDEPSEDTARIWRDGALEALAAIDALIPKGPAND